MTDFDKLFNDLFSDDFDEIEAQLDEIDAAEAAPADPDKQVGDGDVDDGSDEPANDALEQTAADGFDEMLADGFDPDAIDFGGPDAGAVDSDTNPGVGGLPESGDGDGASTSGRFEDEEDDEFIEDTEVGGVFEASCPFCGEPVSLFLDPAGGAAQDYVEDCSVCCQPMTVRVRFDGDGQADVMIDTAD